MAITRTATSPALEQARRLQAAADIFNRELFGNKLPPTMLRLERLKNSRGCYQPDKFVDEQKQSLDCITLNSTDATNRPLIELLSTLVHEQCHQYICRVVNKGAATGGHGPEWRKKMEQLGLPPIKVGATWRGPATHSIDPAGGFATCFRNNLAELQRLPWQELAKDPSRGRVVGLDRIVHQCPSCGSKARARPAAELLCGTCTTADPLNLVRMIPEIEVEGGGRGTTGAKRTRTDYPEPSATVGLPVWTDDCGRELRLHTGLDHPPQDRLEALVVLLFGVAQRKPELIDELVDAADPAKSMPEAWNQALKKLWLHPASVLHPDREGGSELAFKVVQNAYRMFQQGNGKPFYATPEDVQKAAVEGG